MRPPLTFLMRLITRSGCGCGSTTCSTWTTACQISTLCRYLHACSTVCPASHTHVTCLSVTDPRGRRVLRRRRALPQQLRRRQPRERPADRHQSTSCRKQHPRLYWSTCVTDSSWFPVPLPGLHQRREPMHVLRVRLRPAVGPVPGGHGHVPPRRGPRPPVALARPPAQ